MAANISIKALENIDEACNEIKSLIGEVCPFGITPADVTLLAVDLQLQVVFIDKAIKAMEEFNKELIRIDAQ